MNKRLKSFLLLLTVMAILIVNCSFVFAASTAKTISIAVNPVTIKFNGKIANVDSFSFSGRIYLQPQDICNRLNIDYIYDSKAKTVSITDKKPAKQVAPAKAKFNSVKPSTSKKINVAVNALAVKVNGKLLKADNYSYSGAIYVSAKDLAGLLSKDYLLDSKAKVLSFGKTSDTKKLLSKTEVSELRSSVVKVIVYDANHSEMGNGSGFIISQDGTVVTNYHVIDMAPILEVKTSDNVTYQVAGVLKYSVERDIAILKLKNAKSMPVLALGNSDDLKYGEDIVAMGHPLGMSLTVTFGNVSSLDSPGGLTRKDYEDIQFSAPISQGNSGGPLMNMYGEVVGINYSGMSEGQNLNYAIPINELKTMLNGLGSVESLTDVIKAVYPKMNYDEMADYMYLNYPIFSTDGYKFNFDNITISEYSKDPSVVDVYVDLGNEKYKELLRAESSGGKSAAEKWCQDIFNIVKSAYPDKDVVVIVSNVEYFDSVPSGYDDDQIFQDSSTGEYYIVVEKLLFTVMDSTPQSQWLD